MQPFRGPLALAAALAVAAPALLAACAGAPSPEASSSPDTGHAVFALHCARCHGERGTGSASAPPLVPGVRSMSEAAFAAKVLQRTHWKLPATSAHVEGAARDAFLEGVLRMRAQDQGMPAWQSEPQVADAVRALYAYLASLPRP